MSYNFLKICYTSVYRYGCYESRVIMENNLQTSEKVYQSIVNKILNEDWVPGSKITSENQLSKELGVSRMSVREAMEKLVALNVLHKKKGGGTYVNDLKPSMYLNGLIPMILLNKDNLQDILEFRMIIEVDSARLCAERCDKEHISLMKKCYEEMLEYKDHPESFYKADYNFHMAIAKGTKNSLIIKVNDIMTDLLMFHHKQIHQYLGPHGGLKEHVNIINAIENRDGELASLFMKRHIKRTLDEIRQI